MNKEPQDANGDAWYRPMGWLALGSLWAPILWLAVLAVADGSNLADPPSERHFRWEVLYPALSLLTAAAFVNFSLWLVRRRLPAFAVVLWVSSVGISGLLLFGGGLLMVDCTPGDIFGCPSPRDITESMLLVSGVMASFTLPGWLALGVSHLKAVVK